jgi:hypothetical protein
MRSANITRSLTTTLVLCCAPALTHSQAAQAFLIHGTPRSCSAITQLDSALADNSQQFFTGWNEKDYADAAAWAQSCADYGWHVAGRPRLPLLQQQRDRALAAAPVQVAGTATAEVPATSIAQTATPAVQAAAPPAQAADPGAGAQAAAPALQAAVAAVQPAVVTQLSANAASGPDAAVPAAASAAQEPILASAAPGIPLTASVAQTNVATQTLPASAMVMAGGGRGASDPEEESVVTGEYFKKHFHQESLWVANRAHLDIGEDRGPPTWSTSGTSAQLKNRLTADKIVLYCARKTNASESNARQRTDPDNQPLLWDWRWCEAEEAAAYNRLVTGNEFPSAGRGVVLGCAGSDSYIYTERCIQTLIESARN